MGRKSGTEIEWQEQKQGKVSKRVRETTNVGLALNLPAAVIISNLYIHANLLYSRPGDRAGNVLLWCIFHAIAQ